MIRVFCLCAMLFGLAHSAVADKLPVGVGRMDVPDEQGALPLFTYKPASYRDGPLIVAFHGYLGNAEDYRNFAINLAERAHALVVAPLFDPKRFSEEAYHFGNVMREGVQQPPQAWTFQWVDKLVEEVRRREDRPQLPYYLIGHSAGAQFLVRLAAFMPGEARRIVVANPGGLLFPTREARYPHGFGGLSAELSDDDAIRHYLAAPLTIYLGTGDNDPNHATLDRSPPSLAQGPTRLERGRACFEAGRKLAAQRGWLFNWRKVETPGIGHDAALMFAAPEAPGALNADWE